MHRAAMASLRVAATVALVAIAGSPVWGAESAPANVSPPSKEQRERMAEAHEKMAACLRSDRPAADCHREMMQACHDTMGPQGCPMMMGQGPGGMRGRGMRRGPGAAGTPTGTTQP